MAPGDIDRSPAEDGLGDCRIVDKYCEQAVKRRI
jgi:hypothetical protein